MINSRRMHLPSAAVLAALAVVATGLVGLAGSPAAAAPQVPGGAVTRLIVKYQPGVGPQDASGHVTGEDALEPGEQGLRPGKAIGFGYYTVDLPTPVAQATAEGVSKRLERSAKVVSAEPDAIMTIDATENPTPSWGIDRLDQRALPVDSSFSYDTTGAGVTAYIVDTGIRATHADLAGRVVSGVDEVLDGNGTNDCNGHGTHVSGTVGGTSFGVAKAVTLVPVRVLGCTGSGTASGLISGLDWVVSNHAAGAPAVLNMSLGFGQVVASVDTAVARVIASGVTVVVASGNSNVNSCTSTPGDVPEAITVNATGNYPLTGSAAVSDSRASFSNYGSCSDIYAPGVSITSAWFSSDTATNSISGTSMAAPHVTGAAARWLETNTLATPAQVWAALDADATAIPASGLAGDPAKLLHSGTATVVVTPTVPSAPTTVSTTPGNGSLVVSWLPPATTGGSALTYSAALFDAQTGGTQVGVTCLTTSLSCMFSPLTNGVTYWAEVSATNATAPGPAAARVSGIPAVPSTVPGAPTVVSAARSSSGSIAVVWAAGSDGGSPITGFTARAFTSSTGTTPSRTCTGSATTCTITGLTNGRSYYIDVVASNGIGTGTASTRSAAVVPYTAPSAPRSVSAKAAVRAATVKWSTPSSTGGSPITGYIATAYSAQSGGATVSTCSTTAGTLTCSIPSLTTGTTYYVSVVAKNAAGAGSASSRVSVKAL